MDYSIIIPVFNKAALTRHCLRTLRATLAGAGEGEVIVIDNASSDETPEMLREFPWVRVVRNERNLGFAGANNQGAALAGGEFLVLLNNDTEAKPGWLASMLSVAREPGVGVVGARLLFPDGTLQHAGAFVVPFRFGAPGFGAFHDLYNGPGEMPEARGRHDYQVVTGACMLTPRSLYAEVGGLDEGFWNGYEDIDYCLKVRSRGLRVVYDGEAVLTHFESQSGTQRWRKASWNIDRLTQRWNGRVDNDMMPHHLRRGTVRREIRLSRAHSYETIRTPQTTILVHGDVSRSKDAAFVKRLTENHAPVEHIAWAAEDEAVAAAIDLMERRGDRYFAAVDSRCELAPNWLDELVAQAEYGWTVGAATYAPELPVGPDISTFAADARCTLLAMRKFPAHERLDASLATLDGAIADFLVRAVGSRVATRGASRPVGTLPAPNRDVAFEEKYGYPVNEVLTTDVAPVEAALRTPRGRRDGLVSIVMLSWNAPQFTKLALESIREYTSHPYEVIIVDNGSKAETTDWLRTLDDVTVIYNAENRGYAGGNNQGIAAARGEYVVLLNNDVIVTEGWLDTLLSAFDRVPGLGVSAPRSNRVAGHQVTTDSAYPDIPQMHAYAAKRRERWRGHGYVTDRAIGLCLCIDRRVIEEVGGIDERFGVGNFEDDDFCLRVRAAGYRIYVCDDAFIHHFGSQTFAANKIDWQATMRENWSKFAAKWDLPPAYPENGYNSAAAIRRGYDRSRHYVPLAVPAQTQTQPKRESAASYSTVFAIVAADERSWSDVASFAKRYLSAFTNDDATLLAIATVGNIDAETAASRINRLVERMGLDAGRVADVDLSDEHSVDEWKNALRGTRVVDVAALADCSPSALRRLVELEPANAS